MEEKKLEEELDPVEQILDEDNNANVVLYDEDDKATEFEQIAVVPLDNSIYAILKPVKPIEGVEEDEAIVFEIVMDEENGDLLTVVTDDAIIDNVFEEYKKLFDASK